MSFKDSILKLKNAMNHCRRDPASICDTLARGFADLYDNAEGGGSGSQDYSTNEHIIGTWIDGITPVYERIFTGTKSDYDGSIVADVSYIDTMIECQVCFKGSTDAQISQYYISDSDKARCWIESDHKLWIDSGSEHPIRPYTYIIIIRYTKVVAP